MNGRMVLKTVPADGRKSLGFLNSVVNGWLMGCARNFWKSGRVWTLCYDLCCEGCEYFLTFIGGGNTQTMFIVRIWTWTNRYLGHLNTGYTCVCTCWRLVRVTLVVTFSFLPQNCVFLKPQIEIENPASDSEKEYSRYVNWQHSWKM